MYASKRDKKYHGACSFSERFLRQASASQFFVISAGDALHFIEESPEGDVGVHGAEFSVREGFEVSLPFGFEVFVEDFAIEFAGGAEVEIAGNHETPVVAHFAIGGFLGQNLLEFEVAGNTGFQENGAGIGCFRGRTATGVYDAGPDFGRFVEPFRSITVFGGREIGMCGLKFGVVTCGVGHFVEEVVGVQTPISDLGIVDLAGGLDEILAVYGEQGVVGK
jgi:hypothetical protein